jgi:hypothetical protein
VTTASEAFPAEVDLGDSLDVLQQKVQRHLGHCMLRLQQYERLLKSKVANMAVEGPFEQLQAKRAEQVASMSDRSLGTLVRKFTGSHLNPSPSEGETTEPEATGSGSHSPGVAWASIRFNISMSPECYAETKAGLVELVRLRNDLVHHLIERFDISDENGCRAATTHLESCYEKIDGHCQILRAWATGFAESQTLASSFLQSKVFEDEFVHGINPDGSVCWRQSTIVECLREAETACQVDGWTSLDEAIAYISRTAPGQFPGKYRCKTWRQVLTKSKLFECQNTRGSEGKRGQAQYRALVDSTQL